MKYSMGSLIKATLMKIFETKGAKLAVSGVAALISAYLAEVFRSHGWSGRQFGEVLQFLIFAVLIMSIAYFVSNIGAFKKWKFITAASVSTVLLWLATPFIEVYFAIDFSQSGDFWQLVRGAALYYIPKFLLALGAVLILGRLLLGKKKQA